MGLTGPLPEHVLRLMSARDRALLGKGGLTASEAIAMYNKRLEREEQRLFARELERFRLPYYWHRTDKRTGATCGTPDFIVGESRGGRFGLNSKLKGASSPMRKLSLPLGSGYRDFVCISAVVPQRPLNS
jgi:hypothetical protein